MGNCGSSEVSRRQRDSERAAAALVDAIDSLEQAEPPPANDAPGRVSMAVDLFRPDASCQLGLALTGDHPCTITAVQPNGVAAKILVPGDYLFSVNGVEVHSSEDAGRLLSQLGSLRVHIHRDAVTIAAQEPSSQTASAPDHSAATGLNAAVAVVNPPASPPAYPPAYPPVYPPAYPPVPPVGGPGVGGSAPFSSNPFSENLPTSAAVECGNGAVQAGDRAQTERHQGT